MVDAKDGFGNTVNVMRTVKKLEAAGVSAIEIEDNVVPKRFHSSGSICPQNRSRGTAP